MAAQARGQRVDFSSYQYRPTAYFREVLKYEFVWESVSEAIEAIHEPPYRVLVTSGHKIGKTHAIAGLINYWFDCFNPSIVLTMGPSDEAMTDTVWVEVKLQRTRAGLPDYFVGDTELWTSPDHWAKLYSVRKSESFQGRHRAHTLILFDEATAVERPMFTVAKSMFKPERGNAWLCFCNPTDPAQPIYHEEQSTDYAGAPVWRSFKLSSLNHPNIVKQLEFRKQGIEIDSSTLAAPNAVSLAMVDVWVADWTEKVHEDSERVITDFLWLWPNGVAEWRRPMMEWEARVTGNWPSQSTSSVWSDHLLTVIAKSIAPVPVHELPEIGCDVAREGDDKTAVHSRYGCLSLNHESRQGLKTTETTGWLIETARNLAEMVNHLRTQEDNKRPIVDPKEIAIKVDDDGVGGGVVDRLMEQGYHVIGIGAGTNALNVMRYPNKRSELWFMTKERAVLGGVALSRLDRESLKRLKLQALAPTWKLDSAGRRVVEPKKETKKRLGRSPDDMDAMNLAYYEVGWDIPSSEVIPAFDHPHIGPPADNQEPQEAIHPARSRRRMFGP